MKKIAGRVLCLALMLMVLVIPMACNEKESDLGLNLQDPSTRFDGIRDTAYVTAYTVFDDSLRTSGIASTILGRYNSPVYGSTEAIYYTQIGLPSDGGISIDDNFNIDSIVMYLRIESFHPFSEDSSKHYNLNFEIHQLQDQLIDTNQYYSDTAFSVSNVVLYDEECSYSERDTVLKFKLNENSYSLFKTANNQDEFQKNLKGFRIRLKENSTDDAMVVINLAAVSSKVRMYWRYGDAPKQFTYDFVCGQKVGHYSQFIHDYSSTPLRRFENNKLDTIKEDPLLYLTPMGGTNLYLRIDDFIKQFYEEHKSAVIHYAELLLPVEEFPDEGEPDKLVAYRYSSAGYVGPIADLLDKDLMAGFDGTYDKERKCYRLRISRHVQQLLRTQVDYGTLIVLNSRRSSARSVVFKKPVRIEFIYTEIAE